jgi:hypothetical protein
MTVRDGDWVGVLQASAIVNVPASTIRDWYRSGVIGSMTTSQGARLVSLPEVKSFASGEGHHDRRNVKGLMRRSQEQLKTDAETAAALNRTVTDLQGAARDRLGPTR